MGERRYGGRKADYWDIITTPPNPSQTDLNDPKKTSVEPARRALGAGAGLRGKALDEHMRRIENGGARNVPGPAMFDAPQGNDQQGALSRMLDIGSYAPGLPGGLAGIGSALSNPDTRNFTDVGIAAGIGLIPGGKGIVKKSEDVIDFTSTAMTRIGSELAAKEMSLDKAKKAMGGMLDGWMQHRRLVNDIEEQLADRLKFVGNRDDALKAIRETPPASLAMWARQSGVPNAQLDEIRQLGAQYNLAREQGGRLNSVLKSAENGLADLTKQRDTLMEWLSRYIPDPK